MFLFGIVSILITQVIVCVVGIAGLYRFKVLSPPLRYLLLYIWMEVIIDIVKDVMSFHKIHTLWLSQCFSVIELLLFVSVFCLWGINKQQTTLLWWAYAVYGMVWIIGKFTFEPLTGSDVYSGAVSQLIQISFGAWILNAVFNGNTVMLKRDPRFWVLSGIVLYASATFFLFGMFNEMLKISQEFMRKIWLMNLAFIIIQHWFFLRAFLCKPEPASETDNGSVVGTVV
jgi:hypothetical protein